MDAVPLVQVFALFSVLRAVSPLVPQLLNAMGNARLNFFYSLSNSLIMPAAFVVGAQFGLMGVVWSWAVGYPVVLLLLFYFGARELEMPLPRFMARAFSGLTVLVPLAALGIGLQAGLERLTPLSTTLTLAVGISLTVLAGLGTIYWRERETIALLRGNGDAPDEDAACNEESASEEAQAV
jgi:O-antigen/teichoic acid export membrane protein